MPGATMRDWQLDLWLALDRPGAPLYLNLWIAAMCAAAGV